MGTFPDAHTLSFSNGLYLTASSSPFLGFISLISHGSCALFLFYARPGVLLFPIRRPLIVVLNRVDTASSVAVAQWKKYLVTEGGLRADNRGGNVPVFFVDSKRGRGVHEVWVGCWCGSATLVPLAFSMPLHLGSGGCSAVLPCCPATKNVSIFKLKLRIIYFYVAIVRYVATDGCLFA